MLKKSPEEHIEDILGRLEGKSDKAKIQSLLENLIYWQDSSDFWYDSFMKEKEARARDLR